MTRTRLFACLSILFLAASAAMGEVKYQWTSLAGSAGGVGDADGPGRDARFQFPHGVAVDASGNLYVADTENRTIRKITSAGVVSTLAGSPRQSGSADGTGSDARFSAMEGIAVDASGIVYVADTDNGTIRKITPDGVVTTLAGDPRQADGADGTGRAAHFFSPTGLAVDADGNVYVADSSNYTIRKITAQGVVTTLAGSAGQIGSADGTGAAARFSFPSGVAVHANGTVFVADFGNSKIRMVTSDGVVTTLAGNGIRGSTDGNGQAAEFYSPYAVAVDAAMNVFVSVTPDFTIRKVTIAGDVTTFAGMAGRQGSLDATGSAARFGAPRGLALDGDGNLYVADQVNHAIRKVTSAGEVTTFAGGAAIPANTDGPANSARFNMPAAVVADAAGNVFVADDENHELRKVSKAAVVTTLAGSGFFGDQNGTGSGASFGSVLGVAVDASGNVFVADNSSGTIRKVTAAGVVTTFAGSRFAFGSVDGTGTAARFNSPYGLAIDAHGDLYVTDNGCVIRKVTSAGVVTTIVGTAGVFGSADGTGAAAQFRGATGIAVDGGGNLYVADAGNFAIRKVTSAGVVTTMAGNPNGSFRSQDGIGSAATFDSPRGVAVDADGNILVVDEMTIRRITSAGVVTTVGGLAGVNGNQGGVGEAARFTYPRGVAIDATGQVYVAGAANDNIAVGTPLRSLSITQAGVTLVSGASTVDWGQVEFGANGSQRVFSVTNQGAATLTGLTVGIDAAAGDYVLTRPLGAPALAPGESTTFTVTFNPTALGSRTAALHLTGDPNEPPFDLSLSGTGVDTTPPIFRGVSLTSSNAQAAWARAGDTLTVHVITNEALQTPSITIVGQAATVTGNGTDWTGKLNVTGALPQGPVSFSVVAQDLVGNSSTVGTKASGTQIDTVPPVVTAPADVTVNAMESRAVTVTYPPATANDAASAVSLVYSRASGSVFPVGTTTVNVTATDAANNAATTSFRVTVRDTTAPRITGRFTPLFVFVGQPLPNYLAQATIDDVSPIVAQRQSPAAGSPILYPGNLEVTISATDASGNIGVVPFEVKVRPTGLLSELQATARPGTPLGGGILPADARFVSFNDPTIDDAGTVVYSYVWSSARSGRGVALGAPGLSLSTGRTLIPGALAVGDVGNPVIDDGHLAVLGSLRRTAAPTVGALFDLPAGGTLSTALRTLNDAPDTGGATFKDFAQIGVSGSSLAFVAHLALNTGVPKTLAATDSGIWAQDAAHPLKLLLREGQDVGGKKIKTLVAFQPGNGSPGQGRGWVLNVNGVTQVHALALFTDGTQALVMVDNAGRLTVLSSTGPLGTGRPEPSVGGSVAAFASYGIPAMNTLGDHAFLGTLAVDSAAGVSLTNNRRIFLRDRATGAYHAVVKLGDSAPGVLGVTNPLAGAKFSLLYDPVLNDDGGLAFRSLLAGVRAANNDSLWWQPAGGSLRLVAQEGQRPADSNIATEKWLSFTSLAIRPGGGPIFIATVTGGVTGVWATDHKGTVRQLFRTGDLVEGRKLTAFAVLKALPGTMGMTRSFNGTQLLVWRAAFKDGTAGIVQTVVP